MSPKRKIPPTGNMTSSTFCLFLLYENQTYTHQSVWICKQSIALHYENTIKFKYYIKITK